MLLVVVLALVAGDVERIQRHLAVVETELEAADTQRLSPEQRARRASLVRTLATYRDRGEFPRNPAIAGITPVFVDARGVPCAMAHLIETHGGGALVQRVATTNNYAYVRELAGDPALQAWLSHHGLTVAEAARIQPFYGPYPGDRCSLAYDRCAGSTCVAAGGTVEQAFCASACDPDDETAPACPIGLDDIPMECRQRGDRFLCLYPDPDIGQPGGACRPQAVLRASCDGWCLAHDDDETTGTCYATCDEATPCESGYACVDVDPAYPDPSARYCEVDRGGGCAATPAAGLAPFAFLVTLRLRLRRRRASR